MSKYDFELDLNSKNTISIINSWIKENSSVLEFGPANGRLTKYLSEQKNCHVTIVEIDVEAGNKAAEYAECAFIGPIRGNINNFCWLEKKTRYDYVIFADVLEHLSDPEQILLKCKEVLADQGEILISIPNIAHNSILIDLYNDKFNYDDVGLLDRTHIHFFTYHSFQQMIRNVGLSIAKQDVIYSNVGWNEISNSYADVPFNIERELRKRTSGCIYQYVFSLSMQEQDSKLDFEHIEILQDEINEQREISCFYWKKADDFDGFVRIGQTYYCNQNNTCRFRINDKVVRLRLDPIEDPALLISKQIVLKFADGSKETTEVMQHNATAFIGDLYYFTEYDPYFEIKINNNEERVLEYVEICFQILDHNMDYRQLNIYDFIFDKLLCSRRYTNQDNTQKLGIRLEKEFLELQDYTQHLEKDLSELQSRAKALEKDLLLRISKNKCLESDLAEARQYIEHQETELCKSKAYIEKLEFYQQGAQPYIVELEQNQEGFHRYIKKLEKDQEESQTYIKQLEHQQQSYIQQLEYEKQDSQRYVAHLEHDISTLKNDIITIQQEHAEYINHLENDIDILKKQLCTREENQHV